MRSTLLIPATVLLLAAAPALAGVADTVHNLSASGPGTVKAVSEDRVCVFCHTPHNASASAQLWNRADPSGPHTPYSSTTMNAAPGQPTGASRLCLSCHDGTVALGSTLTETTIDMGGGVTTLPVGDGNLGTSLHDDHPVSFVYGSALAIDDGALASPATLTGEVRLDAGGELQCTSCHDPHDDSFDDFLVLPATDAALCETCHVPDGWTTAGHNLSAGSKYAMRAGVPSPNSCRNCHDPHAAPGPARLATSDLEEMVCLACHNAAVPAVDIDSELSKYSAHSVSSTNGVHEPDEPLPVTQQHVECVDCHNPHAARSGAAAAPAVGGPLEGVRGVDGDGTAVETAAYVYEVCYKCHADAPGAPAPTTPRQLVQGNTRLEFDPGNPSFHPVEAPGTNPDVPSLVAPWTEAGVIGCIDCHNNDDGPAAGGTGPNGPHGSANASLLGWNFETGIQVESAAAYELCYRCHDRTSILSDNTFRYHTDHIVDAGLSCNICHDPHGVSATQGDATNHSHLINFDITYTFIEPLSGDLFFEDLGYRSGSCTLRCHGKNHPARSY